MSEKKAQESKNESLESKKESDKEILSQPVEASEEDLTEVVAKAKEDFAHIGGDNAAFVRQALVPALKEAGIKLVK